ncbi:MAG: AAA family ATPase [Methanophagales archaeon]|nr:AAA family ATPase [Methanophagales archaeon]
MIKKLTVENYKSFGDKTEIELGKFAVLVGPNNSGKSNFLDLLSFVSELIREGLTTRNALDKRGSYKSVVFNGEEDRDICLSIETKGEKEERIEYGVRIGNTEENPVKEHLTLGEKDLIKGEEGKGQFWNHKKGKYEEFTQPNYLYLGYLNRNYKEHVHPSQVKFGEFLEGIEIYNFELSKLRERKSISEEARLNKDGSNLSQVIHYLRNKDRVAYAEFEDTLKAAVPEVKYLETPPTDRGEANLEIVERDLEKRIDLSEMSDGMLWLLAHIYVFMSPKSPPLVCFEEPESYIHPRVLELLVDVFKSVKNQVIVTTHNPFFVDLVDPEDLIIFEKKEGKTTCRKIENPEEMKERVIKDIPLGEVWCSGEIGGVP